MRVLVAQTWFRAVPVKNFFLNSRSLVLMVIFVVEAPFDKTKELPSSIFVVGIPNYNMRPPKHPLQSTLKKKHRLATTTTTTSYSIPLISPNWLLVQEKGILYGEGAGHWHATVRRRPPLTVDAPHRPPAHLPPTTSPPVAVVTGEILQ
ncbi:hypothetical protein QTP88_008324 [Uroleucon formosanum]